MAEVKLIEELVSFWCAKLSSYPAAGRWRPVVLLPPGSQLCHQQTECRVPQESWPPSCSHSAAKSLGDFRAHWHKARGHVLWKYWLSFGIWTRISALRSLSSMKDALWRAFRKTSKFKKMINECNLNTFMKQIGSKLIYTLYSMDASEDLMLLQITKGWKWYSSCRIVLQFSLWSASMKWGKVDREVLKASSKYIQHVKELSYIAHRPLLLPVPFSQLFKHNINLALI